MCDHDSDHDSDHDQVMIQDMMDAEMSEVFAKMRMFEMAVIGSKPCS